MTFLKKRSHPQQQDLVGQGATIGRMVVLLLSCLSLNITKQDVSWWDRTSAWVKVIVEALTAWRVRGTAFISLLRAKVLTTLFFFFTTNVLFHYSSFQNITRFHICLLIWAALSCVGQKLWSTICPVIIEFFDYFAEKKHSSEFSPQLNTIRGPGSTDWASLVISFTLLYFYWGKRIVGRWKVNKT